MLRIIGKQFVRDWIKEYFHRMVQADRFSGTNPILPNRQTIP
jgi:hypothetical protein